jgi:hypothetical protein
MLRPAWAKNRTTTRRPNCPTSSMSNRNSPTRTVPGSATS